MRWIRHFREWRRANRDLTEEIEQHLREKTDALGRTTTGGLPMISWQ
jgi:predicted GTPase